MSEHNNLTAGSIGWIDLTVENAAELRDFYREVVGWQTSEVDMGGYSDYFMNDPATGKAVAGICYARGGNANLPSVWLIYITVEDIGKSLSRCVELGGRIISEPRSAGQGRYCVIQDPAGVFTALYEPSKQSSSEAG